MPEPGNTDACCFRTIAHGNFVAAREKSILPLQWMFVVRWFFTIIFSRPRLTSTILHVTNNLSHYERILIFGALWWWAVIRLTYGRVCGFPDWALERAPGDSSEITGVSYRIRAGGKNTWHCKKLPKGCILLSKIKVIVTPPLQP